MKIEKVLIDTACDWCLVYQSNTIEIEFDEDNIYTLCPTCISKLIAMLKEVIERLELNVPKCSLTFTSR